MVPRGKVGNRTVGRRQPVSIAVSDSLLHRQCHYSLGIQEYTAVKHTLLYRSTGLANTVCTIQEYRPGKHTQKYKGIQGCLYYILGYTLYYTQWKTPTRLITGIEPVLQVKGRHTLAGKLIYTIHYSLMKLMKHLTQWPSLCGQACVKCIPVPRAANSGVTKQVVLVIAQYSGGQPTKQLTGQTTRQEQKTA